MNGKISTLPFPAERIKPVAKNVLELKVAIDDATDKNLEILKDLLSQRLKRAATLSDVIAWAAKEICEKYDPEKKAERSMKRKVAAPPSSRTASIVTKTTATKPGRQPIPAQTVHQVILRDGHGCSHATDNGRCGQRKWVDLHHVIPVSRGGANDADNLKFLCSAHHRMTHRLGPAAMPSEI